MKKIVFATMMCAILLNTYHTVSLAEEKAEEKQEEISRRGLMGSFFETNEFTKPVLIGPTSKSGLTYDQGNAEGLFDNKQTYGSYRWVGFIVSQETKDVKLSLSGIEDFQIEIEGKNVSNPQNKQIIHLEKDRLTPIRIEAISNGKMKRTDLGAIQLFTETESGQKETIGMDQLRNPEFGKQEGKKMIRNANQRSLYNHINAKKETADSDDDHHSDDDNIPDSWELNGYTIKNNLIVKWTEELGNAGYTKFVSNPNQTHTVGDPYTDYEKAAADMPKVNGKETRHPLVAAFPSVKVDLEKVILSKNEDLSQSVSSNHSTNWVYGNTEGASIHAGWEGWGPSVGASAHYEHNETVGHEWGGSNEDSSHLNGADTAHLNANIRYHNVGSGAIFDVEPTIGISLGKDTTLGTIKVEDSGKASEIAPKEAYPKKGTSALALNTMDAFHSQPIQLNKEQFNDFYKNKKALEVTAAQVEGKYVVKNVHGQLDYGNSWNLVRSEINHSTADIKIDTGETVYERKIAAKDYSNPNDLTPELTIREALKIGFSEDITEKSGMLYFKGRPVEEYFGLNYLDKNTMELVKKQLNVATGPFKDVKNLFDVKLEPEMSIILKEPILFDGAEEGFSPLGIDSMNLSVGRGNLSNYREGYSYSVYLDNRDSEKPLEITLGDTMEYGKQYYISLSVAFNVGLKHPPISIWMKGLPKSYGSEIPLAGRADYQRGGFLYTHIKGNSEPTLMMTVPQKEYVGVHFDDISVTEIGANELQEKPDNESWFSEIKDAHDSNYDFIRGTRPYDITAVLFQNNIENVMRGELEGYRVSYNGVDGHFNITKKAYNFEKDGSIKVNLHEYNNGKGIIVGTPDKLKIFAVLRDGTEIEVYNWDMRPR